MSKEQLMSLPLDPVKKRLMSSLRPYRVPKYHAQFDDLNGPLVPESTVLSIKNGSLNHEDFILTLHELQRKM